MPDTKHDASNALFQWVIAHKLTILFALLVIFQAATWYSVVKVVSHTDDLRRSYTQPCGSGYRSECNVNVMNAEEIGRAVAKALRQ